MRGWEVAVIALLVPGLTGCLDEIFERDRVLPPEAFVLADPYPDLVVEVDHVADYALAQESLDILERTLREVTDKREIRVLDPAIIPPAPSSYNDTTLMRLHAETLDSVNVEDASVLHVMVLNGHSEERERALGVAMPQVPVSVVVLYGDNLRHVADTIPNIAYEKVERQTLVHEAGHVLGLVNFGLPMVHAREDPEHAGHSRYEESVMFWASKNFLAAAEHLLDDGFLPYTFDEHDLEDLRAFREGRTQAERVRR